MVTFTVPAPVGVELKVRSEADVLPKLIVLLPEFPNARLAKVWVTSVASVRVPLSRLRVVLDPAKGVL